MTVLVIGYKSKKELKAAIGQPLKYVETSLFGNQCLDNGSFSVAHRPAVHEKPYGREFYAYVTMENGLIKKVE